MFLQFTFSYFSVLEFCTKTVRLKNFIAPPPLFVTDTGKV